MSDVALPKLLGLIAGLCLLASSNAIALSPSPKTASFAYRLSHPVAPLPDAVFETVVAPDAVPYAFDAADTTEHPPPDRTFRIELGLPRNLTRTATCQAIVSVARGHDLPVAFFANLIWQESSFNTRDISRAGALGIAQFMPATAVEYGLINPFEPIHALNVAARFLTELHARFGNLGLAAAAYNAGPTRINNWMAKRGGLPDETRNYVMRITGRPAARWTEADVKSDPEATLMPAKAPCTEVAQAVREQAKVVRVAKLMMALAQTNESLVTADTPAEDAVRMAQATTDGRGHAARPRLARHFKDSDEDKPRTSRQHGRGKDADEARRSHVRLAKHRQGADDDEPRVWRRHSASHRRDVDDDKPRSARKRLARRGKDADDRDDARSSRRHGRHQVASAGERRGSSRRHRARRDEVAWR